MNDGGPAFPSGGGNNAIWQTFSAGMSLRDYFAAAIATGIGPLALTDKKAAQSLLDLGANSYALGIAKMSYGIADAMLAARDTAAVSQSSSTKEK